jgi:hypothetical protein
MSGAWAVDYIISFQQGVDKLAFQLPGVTDFASLGFAFEGGNSILYYGGNIAVVFGVQINAGDVMLS